MGMTTIRSGYPLRVTVTVCVAFSATVYDAAANWTVNWGTSLSVMLMRLVAGVPAVTSGQARSEAQHHAFFVVIQHVVGGGEGEGLRSITTVESDILWHAGVVGCVRPVLVRRLDGDDHRSLRVRAQGDCHHLRIALRDGVGHSPELHRDLRHVAVDYTDEARGRHPRRDPRRQARAEAQQHALSIVVVVVVLSGEGEGHGGVAAVEGDARRHAGVVGADVAPPWFSVSMGMTTVRSGSPLRVTVTVCVPCSVTV